MSKTQYILLLFLIIPFWPLLQVKNEINSHLPDCEISEFSESKDTIQFITQCDCNWLPLDSMITKTQVIYYCDSSTIRQIITFKDGKQDSTYKEYYRSGQLKKIIYYKDGKLNGHYTSYYEDGKLKLIGVWRNYKFIGTQYQYWDNGSIAELRIYKNGQPPLFGKSVYFDELGTEITEDEFKQLFYGW